MPTKLDPASDRVEACHRAATELVEKYGGSENQAAKQSKLSQQTLNKLLKHRQLGIEFADKLAAVYETTVDGLVWQFLKGGDAVRAGDLPGWAKAAEEAEGTHPEYPFAMAAEVRLPIAPRVATTSFVVELAGVLHHHARASGSRMRAQKAAK